MATPEQLAEIGKATRFGSENDPGIATRFHTPGGNPSPQDDPSLNKPWSIHNQLRRIAAQEIDFDDENVLEEKIKGKRTKAYAVAFKALSKAMKGDMKAVEYATNRIDGKMEQAFSMKGIKELMEAPDEVLNDMILAGAAKINSEK